MFGSRSNAAIASQLLFVVMLWGGNNVAVKYQLRFWPPVFTVAVRFLVAGLLLLALMRWTPWFGKPAALEPADRRRLWTHGGSSLALYILIFVFAVKFNNPSTVALFMGTSPVWALLWEERPGRHSMHRYFAALLALGGVLVLFLPSLKLGGDAWTANLIALAASISWTAFSRQCRSFGSRLSGLELTGQTFWRAGLMLMPIVIWELATKGAVWDSRAAMLQVYSTIFSGLIAFALWNNALQVWPTSRAFLFGNLIPVTTMACAWIFLNEPITSSFWTALGLIVGAVLIGQADWKRILSSRWSPGE